MASSDEALGSAGSATLLSIALSSPHAAPFAPKPPAPRPAQFAGGAWLDALTSPALPRARVGAALVAAILYGALRLLCLGGIECAAKSPRRHLSDISATLLIGEVLRVAAAERQPNAPRRASAALARLCASCRCAAPPAWVPLRAASFVVIACAAAGTLTGLGTLSELQNDLSSASAWKAPAIYAYIVGIVLAAALVAIALINAVRASRRSLFKTLGAAAAVALFIGVAAAIAARGPEPGHAYTKRSCYPQLHVHHWILGAALFAVLSCVSDPSSPLASSFTRVLRAVAFGIMLCGLSSYGPDGILDSGLCPRA